MDWYHQSDQDQPGGGTNGIMVYQGCSSRDLGFAETLGFGAIGSKAALGIIVRGANFGWIGIRWINDGLELVR